jgi:hypothetical protein
VFTEVFFLAKKKTAQTEDDAKILDDIYLEISDTLRSLKLERLNLDSSLSEDRLKLKEIEAGTDPNRKLFHVSSANVFDAEADEIRKRICEKEEAGKKLDDKTAETEIKRKAIHNARKLMFRLSNEEGGQENTIENEADDVSISTAETSGTAETQDNNSDVFSEKEKRTLKRRLSSCIDALELASRVTGFDPERARVELSLAITKLNEIISGL